MYQSFHSKLPSLSSVSSSWFYCRPDPTTRHPAILQICNQTATSYLKKLEAYEWITTQRPAVSGTKSATQLPSKTLRKSESLYDLCITAQLDEWNYPPKFQIIFSLRRSLLGTYGRSEEEYIGKAWMNPSRPEVTIVPRLLNTSLEGFKLAVPWLHENRSIHMYGPQDQWPDTEDGGNKPYTRHRGCPNNPSKKLVCMPIRKSYLNVACKHREPAMDGVDLHSSSGKQSFLSALQHLCVMRRLFWFLDPGISFREKVPVFCVCLSLTKCCYEISIFNWNATVALCEMGFLSPNELCLFLSTARRAFHISPQSHDKPRKRKINISNKHISSRKLIVWVKRQILYLQAPHSTHTRFLVPRLSWVRISNCLGKHWV